MGDRKADTKALNVGMHCLNQSLFSQNEIKRRYSLSLFLSHKFIQNRTFFLLAPTLKLFVKLSSN